MSNPYAESATNNVLFPDDLVGKKLNPISDEPIPAEDVPEDDAKYGHYVECELAEATTSYVNAPKQLRYVIGEHYKELMSDGYPVLEVTEAKRGPADHDPWEFETRLVREGEPL